MRRARCLVGRSTIVEAGGIGVEWWGWRGAVAGLCGMTDVRRAGQAGRAEGVRRNGSPRERAVGV